MTLRLVVRVACLAVLITASAAAERSTAGSAARGGEDPPLLQTALEAPRPETHDVIFFRNGDVLHGTVINETLRFRSSWDDVALPIRRCAVVAFRTGVSNDDVLVTVNRNRFTGRILEKHVRFRVASSDQEISLKPDRIRAIALRRSTGELDFLGGEAAVDLIVTTNGDVLTGSLRAERLVLTTEYATVEVALERLRCLEIDEDRHHAAMLRLDNGDILRGELDAPGLALQLDLGLEAGGLAVESVQAVVMQCPVSEAFRQLDRYLAGRIDPTPLVERLVRGASSEAAAMAGGLDAIAFCGLRAESAGSVVYVLDASGSMIRPFPQLVDELEDSLAALGSDHRFAVLAATGSGKTARFQPGPLATATEAHKNRVLSWIRTNVQAAGRADLPAALTQAIDLHPDVIFVVSQGSVTFPSGAGESLAEFLQRLDELNPVVDGATGRRRARIFGVQLGDPDPSETLRRIALRHGGGEAFAFISRKSLEERTRERRSAASATGAGDRDDGEENTFFGMPVSGKNVAFIVDRSGSMGQNRKMRFARLELARAIQGLPDDASFYVLLFSTDVIEPPMQQGWTRAEKENANRFIRWLNQVDPTGGTQPIGAFQRIFALDVRPDLIFFLTDGQIPENTADLVADLGRRGERVTINTIAFGDPSSQDLLKRIARQSGGEYRFIPMEDR